MTTMKMNVNPDNRIVAMMVHHIQHYNPKRYWRWREIVVNPNSRVPKMIKLFMLLYIKRCDAFNNASMGTDINQGAVFAGRPELPHGLNGIIIHMGAKFGKNCVIYQQVTVGGLRYKRPTFGDNVVIGAGAKILGGVHVGDNVKIGANAVITKDVPSNCTVVGAPMRIINNENG
ncbi:2,3,4,5-tetrahydropyridine-2,6-dicarboxylate N-acetyltransferase [Bacteroides pyogenes]|uniref:serine O-acetyltransferase n=1 Tax=Bacteroides pyogenes TaxID=310300 RepID=UPI001BAD4555|nr:DapH/DapD/GlmU-related protein [Bacteroides pyogenes]MBR8719423.1 2,3,4,5-tetrahydropyridine-2,6-dicarboxylate N-acetyltransferase [Bacteroides pyogenes]MBR8786292.1 2,3,4,5-tetrahydropyridine-2,6-dicarboxylate N-acetyltransferase [Bacteroides pyogenes]MBR8791775.1 2,3,4,5-tetrahydropyridine-2,6-dicarboxylate N-acetyltransferase [Bacteroides pyogenes]MCF2708807.1 transferase [Bacteroides pyogenes]